MSREQGAMSGERGAGSKELGNRMGVGGAGQEGLTITLPTASNAILRTHRTINGNQRGSVVGIISEPTHLGGMIWMQQFVAKFAYSASKVIQAGDPRLPKMQRGTGDNFPSRFTRVAKTWSRSLEACYPA